METANIIENQTVLTTKGLTVHYKKFCALDNLSLSIKAGEIVGIIGPNGAGTVSYTHLTLPTILRV